VLISNGPQCALRGFHDLHTRQDFG
jgi:hypothetical protein